MKSQPKVNVDFRLLVVSDRKLTGKNFIQFLKKISRAGVKAIQLREKDLPAGELLKLARGFKSAVGRKTRIIINDRLDIALLSGASGVHSPVNGISPEQVKQFAPKMVCGKSVHSLSEAVSAEKKGFDYLMLGPIYRTPAKTKFGSPLGLDLLKRVCKKVRIPVFAVGGINPSRAAKCIEHGAHGVAVIREVMTSNNIRKTISEFKKAIGSL